MSAYWLSLATDALSTFAALAFLYEGSRLLSSKGLSRRAALLAGVGAAMCLTLGGIHFAKYRVVQSSINAVTTPIVPEQLPPPSEWSKSMTPIEREVAGHQIASANYMQSGALNTYADRFQQPRAYVPTQAEVKEREELVAGLAVLRELERERFADTVRWIVWAMLAVLCGFVVGRVSRNVR